MKKIVYTIITGTIVAFTLNSCNNAEEVAKQKEAENTAIQEQVDAKLNELQTEASAACQAQVDSLATAMYDEWYAKEGKKKGAKPAVKPKPAPKPVEEPKKEEPKKVDVGQTGVGGNDNKINVGQTGSTGTNQNKINVGQKK